MKFKFNKLDSKNSKKENFCVEISKADFMSQNIFHIKIPNKKICKQLI